MEKRCSDRNCTGLMGRSCRLVGRDVGFVLKGEADVVESVQQTPAGVLVELEVRVDPGGQDLALLQVDRDLGGRVGLGQLPEGVHRLLRQDDGEQAVLQRVAAEDVGEPGGDDRLEAVVLERPDGVLTGGAGAEVGAG